MVFQCRHLFVDDGNLSDLANRAAAATSTLPFFLCNSKIASSLVNPISTILWMLASGKLATPAPDEELETPDADEDCDGSD